MGDYKHSEETIRKIAESNKGPKSELQKTNHALAMAKRKGKENPNAWRKVIIDGIEYKRIKNAAEALGVTPTTIYNRAKRGTLELIYPE